MGDSSWVARHLRVCRTVAGNRTNAPVVIYDLHQCIANSGQEHINFFNISCILSVMFFITLAIYPYYPQD